MAVLIWVPLSFSVGAVLPMSSPALEVPSLTSWGKVFSLLLLGALGVAYLVWRRPVVQAQAILETSPLGPVQVSPVLVDPVLYLKVLVFTELAGIGLVCGVRWLGRAVSTVDTVGVLASGAIVAFVVHLLWLGRRSS